MQPRKADPAAPRFSGSYSPDDVQFLIKPARIALTAVAAKEDAIQSGRLHYSEMLSPEQVPDARYLELYDAALARNAGRLRADIELLADRIVDRVGADPTLVSLARAGTPIGVLLHRELRRRGRDSAHYSISIIRDRGIDEAALDTIRAERDPASVVFVDGWTGKGAIRDELDASLAHVPDFAPVLAVVADPAGVADIAATHEDYLIPSGILNGIVSGLISRTVLSSRYVGPGDYHACLYLSEHEGADRSIAFIEAIETAAPIPGVGTVGDPATVAARARATVDRIMTDHGVADRNRVKPGIAESTRAILRRMPDRLFLAAGDDPDLAHLRHLAIERGLRIDAMPDNSPYRSITVIRKVSE
ncbi:cysteine protease StiP domain-containing protein [Sphingomonas sp. HF-S3]|uniref:Cysteine protease StiP domain-containing protein n=1 Tax=Sphingomonas rustica TaxID=3103142 RepID=A0ABV0BCZ3_9SPHN